MQVVEQLEGDEQVERPSLAPRDTTTGNATLQMALCPEPDGLLSWPPAAMEEDILDPLDLRFLGDDHELNNLGYSAAFMHSSGGFAEHIAAGNNLQLAPPIFYDAAALRRDLGDAFSYSLAQIKSAPSTMLLELQTPWCHASLYNDDIPPAIQGQYRQSSASVITMG